MPVSFCAPATPRAFLSLANLHLHLLLNWTQRWQIRASVLAIILLTASFLWRRRVSILVRQKQMLERAVQRRTAELEEEKHELVRARDQMRHFAEHDGLTGLWNHRIIVDRLRAEVDRSRREHTPISVILADLDHFKQVNDTHGHPCGDVVLRHVAEMLARLVRSYDWVGRYGGEEFLIVLPATGFPHARSRAEELRQAVEAMHVFNGSATVRVTVSMGVASGLARDYEMLMRAADAALYRAKNNGRNCVVATEVNTPESP
jgi:diguanylate cyclase (GGDEF)-like protein